MTFQRRPAMPKAAKRQPPAEPLDDRAVGCCHDRRFATVTEISLLADQAAATVADPAAILTEVIRAVVASEADPYVLLGVLAEGTVWTLAERFPDERRAVALQGFLQIIGSRIQCSRSR
jgi:hypothetical protein